VSHADTRKGFHPDWKTFIFNYAERSRSFLTGSGLFWLTKSQRLRVDAVRYMLLYLDYSRKQGGVDANNSAEWRQKSGQAMTFYALVNTEAYKEIRESRPLA